MTSSWVTVPSSSEAIASLDRTSAPDQIVKTTLWPSGRAIGQSCSTSPLAESGRVNWVSSPPATLTLERPARAPVAPVMSSPFVLQSAPLSAPPSAMVTGALPSSRTFFSFPATSNATQAPSGENSGWLPSSVPGMGWPSSWSERRAYRIVTPRRPTA